jgi:putative SOS response-associated peptidase YedK
MALDLMEMYEVSPLVNNVGNDSADLIVPVGDTPLLGFWLKIP